MPTLQRQSQIKILFSLHFTTRQVYYDADTHMLLDDVLFGVVAIQHTSWVEKTDEWYANMVNTAAVILTSHRQQTVYLQ